MRSLSLAGLGIGFFLMGLGLLALTFRKAKAPPVNPTKTQLREQADLAQEKKKMLIAASVVGGFGLILFLIAAF